MKMAATGRRTRIIAWFLIAIGLAALASAVAIYMRRTGDVPPPLPQQLVVPGETAAPAPVERPSAKAVANYKVAPALPKYISIPAIGVSKARILPLGLTSDSAIATPVNGYDTGWYNGSAKPGQAGAMFIYGHVAGWNEGGVFYNLKKLKPGDKIIVTRGDDAIYTYRVDSLKAYPVTNVDMNTVLSPTDPTKPGLNLMTCVWTVVNGKSEFNSRQVVFSSLVTNK
jgi:LPXTG-site transpeptidase (sortase) family protein